MKTCTFFGHKDCDRSLEGAIREAMIRLIEDEGVSCFYVGNHGNFDHMAARVLKELKAGYPKLSAYVVLAYLPKASEFDPEMPLETLFPEGLESVPKRFAISRRNDWMLKQSQYVIAYVKREIGGAASFYQKALRQKKHVINLAPPREEISKTHR
ncbi:MAG: DUF1273 family protein [Clostridia bacterium]|nr:DUF1273 family protein [Clostridia bacterium]